MGLMDKFKRKAKLFLKGFFQLVKYQVTVNNNSSLTALDLLCDITAMDFIHIMICMGELYLSVGP